MLKIISIAAMLITGIGAANAQMTCADYADSAKAFAWCRKNIDGPAGRLGLFNCCAGASAWKAACDVFHVLAEDHVGASNLAYSTPEGTRAAEANMKECTR